MRLGALVFACLLAVSLAGCSGDGNDVAQTREDCTDNQSFNPFEQKCVSSDFEVCRAWLNGGIPDDQDQEVSCQIDSDGKAWLDWGFGVSNPIHVTVTDGADEVVFENNISNDQDRAKVTGAKGRWKMTVDFQGAGGSGEIYLWG